VPELIAQLSLAIGTEAPSTAIAQRGQLGPPTGARVTTACAAMEHLLGLQTEAHRHRLGRRGLPTTSITWPGTCSTAAFAALVAEDLTWRSRPPRRASSSKNEQSARDPDRPRSASCFFWSADGVAEPGTEGHGVYRGQCAGMVVMHAAFLNRPGNGQPIVIGDPACSRASVLCRFGQRLLTLRDHAPGLTVR
jgi:hypothetical protein